MRGEPHNAVAEYSLRGAGVPIGVAEYRMREALPVPLRDSLPSAEELETELSRVASGALAVG
ncbi:MAG TPA: hypothetical protein VFQ39_08230 [Longimicrobium sp.]|nr:hypothetical protein [Longimicrobium sp.]